MPDPWLLYRMALVAPHSSVERGPMAKKIRRKRRAKPCRMMVIRVSVPGNLVPDMKLWRVVGIDTTRARLYTLEMLSAYYDMRGQPNALVDT